LCRELCEARDNNLRTADLVLCVANSAKLETITYVQQTYLCSELCEAGDNYIRTGDLVLCAANSVQLETITFVQQT
jgi:hypothetical protein